MRGPEKYESYRQDETKMEKTKKLAVGILAHVDAGKTTLAEGILYKTGQIRKAGRVDHKDAFLDTEELEKARGITIFSKQAVLKLNETEVTLLDTPGHVDFSAEMERTLQVMDYAVLLISGADGVQGHVETLWRLLARYEIPVFLFINKMDQPGTDAEKLLEELQSRLSEHCLNFSQDLQNAELLEELAMCDEDVLEQYLETGSVEEDQIRTMIAERKVFPCCFGSALKMEGVTEFLKILDRFTKTPEYGGDFGARVFKISRDTAGNRLTHLKITGGVLKVKQMLGEEKADQIRIYSGAGYTMVQEAPAGTICAVTGLNSTFSGQGIGNETEAEKPVLEPVLTYRIELPPDCDVHQMLGKLRQLEEEIPELHIVWNERLAEIHAQVMGEVQIEILKSLIHERFGEWVEFGAGNIVYKETIRSTVEGVGHFEPLRHYAEVHLLLEPAEPGSGLQIGTVCSEDTLDRNWQRLILTHLLERKHPGVLTGSEITDMKITLVKGRAHIKHTEGGDFRQATYRAVRQGLKKAESVLLEPVYAFRLEIPSESTGRALNDIQRMYGSFEPPEMEGDMTVITGTAPVVTMRDYQKEVTAYSRGRGRVFCTLKGYEPCHNEEEVIAPSATIPRRMWKIRRVLCSVPTGQALSFHGMKWKTYASGIHAGKSGRRKRFSRICGRPERRSILCAESKKSIRPRADGSFPAGGKGAGRNLYEDIRQSGAEARRFRAADTSGHLVIRHRGSQICKIKPPEGAAGGISAGGRL